MSRLIKEAGKVYNLSDSGIVTDAGLEDTVIEPVADLKIGDRVSVAGKDGFFRARTASVYGDALAVEFDDGTVQEYLSDEVDSSTSDYAPTYAQTVDIHNLTVDELKEHFAAYNEMSTYTEEELQTKSRVASSVALRANYLLTTSSLSLQDQVDLDTIKMIVENDQKDLHTLQHQAALDQDSTYKRSANARYALAETPGSYAPLMGQAATGDASWLDDALDGMEVTEVTEADLATDAVDMVSKLTREQLEDPSVVESALSFRGEYLGIQKDVEKQSRYAKYVHEASQEKLSHPVVKEANVDEDLANFNTSSLFL